jgi:hypothetical protein
LIEKTNPVSLSDNLVPGVVYGVDDDRNVLKIMVVADRPILEKQLRTFGRTFENTIHELFISGNEGSEHTKHLVLPRQTQFCPGNCLNYLISWLLFETIFDSNFTTFIGQLPSLHCGNKSKNPD